MTAVFRERAGSAPQAASEQPAVRRIVVHNEFAIVAVQLCGEPGRERLSIEDLRTGISLELDALELESLAWASHTDLARLLDPGLTRWVGLG